MTLYQAQYGPLWKLQVEVSAMSACSDLCENGKRHLADLKHILRQREGK